MTKFPKKQLPSTRRCVSSGKRPTFELVRPLKKKSRSNGPQSGRTKKKILRRIVRRGAEMDTEDLLQSLAPYVKVEKKMCEEPMDRSDDSELHELTDNLTSPTNRIHRPRVHPRVKVNNPGIKLLKFKSCRNQVITPCFDEDVVNNTSAELKNMYHKGVKEEDRDSTDSMVQMGVEKAMKHLLAGLNSPSIRRKVQMQKNGRPIEVADDDQSKDYSLRSRTRVNSPQASIRMIESRGSNLGSYRNIPFEKD